MNEQVKIQRRFELMKDSLNEKTRRLFAGAEALAIGHGGVKLVEDATGISHGTISKGKHELLIKSAIIKSDRLRKSGGGRTKLIVKSPEIGVQIEKELDGNTIGNPMSILTWTTKSLKKLSDAVEYILGIVVGRDVIGRYLKSNGYSLQLNRKMIEGGDHIDRNAQFEFIKEKAESFINEGHPVISVDTKKKELIGNFKNAGETWHKKGEAPKVNVYDFPSLAAGKAVPYGVLDIANNIGWVSVGVSADTGEFSVESIRSWIKYIGKVKYPDMKKVYINCDGGGSNGSRCRLRKRELQKLANENKIQIHVSHFPPGTSKRNKIEHRLFCHISKNRKGIPLTDFTTVVNLISNTTTSKGLTVQCTLDQRIYEKGIKISDEELAGMNIEKDPFHGEWNYIISPQNI